MIRGMSDEAQNGTLPSRGEATAFDDDLSYAWNGVDTNFVLRARGGLRLSGGTSTGRSQRDTCFSDLDAPNVKGREGNDYGGGCKPYRPFQTNVRANASYTIPGIDLLVSTVFQYRPGQERSANLQIASANVIWEPDAEERATRACTVQGVAQAGCFYNVGFGGGVTAHGYRHGQSSWTYLADLDGEGIRLWDHKFAEEHPLRPASACNVGVDVYNRLQLRCSDRVCRHLYRLEGFRDGDLVSGARARRRT